jgi:site-specific DNA-methyltransferase (adenine-specific)
MKYTEMKDQYHYGNISLYNGDCMDLLRQTPDKYFDLAIVDPPYGIDINPNMGLKKGQKKRHKKIHWDNAIPDESYFKELMRVSKNQIIWGGNYFPLPPTKHFIFWDKMNPEGLSFSDGEMAWTSFNRAIRKWSRKNAIPGKIHPTQKPIELYGWIIANYANPDNRILDTHLGSGSIAIAVEKSNRFDKMNLRLVGVEIDEEYYQKARNRFNQFSQQGVLCF